MLGEVGRVLPGDAQDQRRPQMERPRAAAFLDAADTAPHHAIAAGIGRQALRRLRLILRPRPQAPLLRRRLAARLLVASEKRQIGREGPRHRQPPLQQQFLRVLPVREQMGESAAIPIKPPGVVFQPHQTPLRQQLSQKPRGLPRSGLVRRAVAAHLRSVYAEQAHARGIGEDNRVAVNHKLHPRPVVVLSR